jgi:hypothetical protein
MRSTDVVCERELFDLERPERRVIVRLGSPRLEEPPTGWECRYSISGLSESPYESRGSGHDGLGALIYALISIREHLDQSGLKLSWKGDDGDTGFPLYFFSGTARDQDDFETAVSDLLRTWGHGPDN